MLLACLVMGTMLTHAETAAAEGTIRSVAPWGSDDAAGTAAAPFRTIGRAFEALGPGDTLVVRGGTYTEQIKGPEIDAGTSTSPVTVMAHPGERPVLRGLLWLTDANHWTISGLNVTWSTANGSDDHMVKLTGGTGWSFTDAEVWDARSYAAILVVGDANAWRLSDLYVHDTHATNGTNQDHLVYINGGGEGGIVERNLLIGSPNGRAVKLGPPSKGSSATKGVRVRYNTMVDNWGPSNVQVTWDASRNIIERNIMVSPRTHRSAVTAYELTGTGNVVRDNLIHDAFQTLDRREPGLIDGGGNHSRDPDFVDPGSGDYRTTALLAASYGRWAGIPPTAEIPHTPSAPGPDAPASPEPVPVEEPIGDGRIGVQGASFVPNSTATSLSLPRPPEAEAGDLLIATVDVRGQPTVTPPPGWVLIRHDSIKTILHKVTYRRWYADGDPGDWVFELSSSQAASGGIVALAGVDRSSPVIVATGRTSDRSTSIGAPPVEVTAGGEVITLFATATDASVMVPPDSIDGGGTTSRGGRYMVTTRVGTSTVGPGTTPSWTAKANREAATIGQTIALRPASTVRSAGVTAG